MTEQIKSVQEQIAEIRAQREKLAQEARVRDEQDELQRELQALKDDQEVARISAEHPAKRTKAVRTPLGCLLVKRPARGEYQRFIDRQEVTYATISAFVRPCLLYPTADRLDAILDEMPGLLTPIQDAVFELAGFAAKDKAVK